MDLTFRLLGPVAVDAPDGPVDVGPARQRTVLAALLVDAGHLVPIDTVVNRVWGPAPPDRSRQTLHVYIARLRQALGPSVRLVGRSGAYPLDLEPDRVDLHRFRALANQADVTMLRQALDLWHGTPLADLSGEWVDRTRERWRQEHVAAAIAWAQGALRLGQAQEIVAPLTEHVAEYPSVEPLAEALRRARDARPPVAHAPALLPIDVYGFTGRDPQLAQLDAVLAENRSAAPTVVISAIAGTAGVGKTALAVHWAHRVTDRFPDGQLYVNLRGFDQSGSVMSPPEAVRGFLDALQVPVERIPPDPGAQAELYRALLAGRRMLVVLDNARDAEQVRPLLPGTPGCLVVVTSRNQLTDLDGALPLALDVLSPAEARQLLVRRLGDARLAAEPAAVDDIIGACAGLPLALAIVAAHAATRPQLPLAEFAAELRADRSGLDTFDGGDAVTNIRAVFSWSYRALAPEAARLFRLLGLHPGPDIAAPAAASLAGLPLEQTRSLLADLAHATLLSEPIPGRYTFHDLLRAYAQELVTTIDTEDSRTMARRQLLDYYVYSSRHAAVLTNPQREPYAFEGRQPRVAIAEFSSAERAQKWFMNEHPVLVAAVGQAATNGFDVHVWHIAWAISEFLDLRGQWQELARTQHAALDAARRLADAVGQALVHNTLSLAYYQLGDHATAEAHVRHACERFRELGNQKGEAHAHANLSIMLGRDGRFREALDEAQHARDLICLSGNKAWEANILNAVGWCYIQLGEYRSALTSCEQALAVIQTLGDPAGEAATWDSLGYGQHHLGNHRQAISCYESALDILCQLGDRYNEAAVRVHLGDSQLAAGDHAAARATWESALTTLTELGHDDAEEARAKLAALDGAN